MRQREPRQRDRPYLLWLKTLPCVSCAVRGVSETRCEAAHCKLAIAKHGWRGGGVQEKSHDRRASPICADCHRLGPRAQHGGSERAFWDRLGICPACLCEALAAAYDAGLSGSKVIWDAVRARRRDGAPTC